MQNLKRKTDVGETPESKKKKVKFAKAVKDGKENKNGANDVKLKTFSKKLAKKTKNNDANDKTVKSFMKNKPKTVDGKRKLANFKGKTLSKDGATEKPKWSEMKKEKKQLKINRKKAKTSEDIFEKTNKAKLLAAQIQRKVIKPEVKKTACKELHSLLKKQYKAIALTHDLSRVIQVLLKYSPQDIQVEITEELLDIIVQMAQSKYAHYTVKRILKYGNNFIRHEVIKRFYGNIVSLATHTISAPLLDYAYGEFASKKEKQQMQQEFYGEIFKNSKDTKVECLKDAYKFSPQLKAAILQSCKANIQKILDKNLHDGELFHSVLYDYMRECEPDERADLVQQLAPLVVPLTNSLPGVNAACMCVWHGTNKDKKTILKVVKEHTESLSKHKTGYRLLLAIFDAVDDTVLVKKTIIAVLANNLRSIVVDHWGNMVIHWLVKPKDTSIFHPSLIKFLEEGAKSGTSKKESEVRISELQEAILPVLLKDVEEDAAFWLSNKNMMLLVVAVLSIKSTREIMHAIASVICKPTWKVKAGDSEVFAVEDAGIHMCLKKLAAMDEGKPSEETLAEAVYSNWDTETIKLWLSKNRGCFFLLKLIQHNDGTIGHKLKKKIKSNATILRQHSSEGGKLLENVVKQ